MTLEWQQLKYFCKAAQIQHMTRAAEELHITQPSLSLSIRRLEQELGVELFDRHGRGIVLNQYGDILLERASAAFSLLDSARAEINDLKSRSNTSSLLVTAPPHIFFPKLIDELRSAPFFATLISLSPTVPWQEMLHSGELDFVVTTPMIDCEGIDSLPITREPGCILVPPDHPLANAGTISLKQFANDKFVSTWRGSPTRMRLQNSCLKAGFRPKIIFEGHGIRELFNLIRSDGAVTIFPVFALHTYNTDGIRVLPLPDGEYVDNVMGLSWLKGKFDREFASGMRDTIAKHLDKM